MKTKAMVSLLALFLGLMTPAFAISKSRLDNVKERAAADKKLIAFVVMLECKNGNCPIAVKRVGDRNSNIKRAIPDEGVIVVKLDPDDLKDGDTPECVREKGSAPCIIVTDAACTKVIDNIGWGANKERIAEMESKIESATKSL